MDEDIDKQMEIANQKLEKLKSLKAKQDEVTQLEIELGVADKKPSTSKAETIEPQTITKESSKRTKTKPFRVSPRARSIATIFIVFCLIACMAFVFVNRVTATAPVVTSATPSNGGTFASTQNGTGVAWAIKVYDADTNLQWVKLYSNDSGSWVLFYDSGALGGVKYHNTSGTNANWTGSWTKYYWNVSANDGSSTNFDYSFTTAYQWGDLQMAYFNDVSNGAGAVILKNATNDYSLVYVNGTNGNLEAKRSTTGTDWALKPKSASIVSGSYLSSAFIYNNVPYVLFYKSSYLYYAKYTAGAWSSGSTVILQASGGYSSIGADAIYYNGKWNMVAGNYDGGDYRLSHYTGTFPSTWTLIASFLSAHTVDLYSYPSPAIHNGILHCIYKDGSSVHWQTYNGVAWTDRGNIGTGSNSPSGYASLVKDPVNNQLVCVYIDSSGNLVYRTTDNLTSWSASHTILSKGAYAIIQPHVAYIDHRLVVSIGYNLRGKSNVYTISSPDYSGRMSGLNYTLNRIQFPDASPGDTNVESTVFSLKNLNNRDIKTITWHFEDIGEITKASNIKVWTNMSGGWNGWTCDVSGDVATLDISGEMLGGNEWVPGQTIYWKVEILAVGLVSEDLHVCDESIFYKITF